MEWISVLDRLPPDGDEYLVRTDYGAYHVLSCCDGKFNACRLSDGSCYDDSEVKRVTHWMPIPEFDEPEAEEDD